MLSPSRQRAFGRLAGDLQRVFRDRFVALVASDQTSSVAFVTDLAGDDLEALAPLSAAWHRDGLATPLVMTRGEFERSLDAFPLEYQAMLDRHCVIAGTPPFAGVTVRAEDLRRACEAQARGHLIHLRQGWIQAGGHDDELIALLGRSAAPFRALLSNVARLHRAAHDTDADLAAFAHDRIGMSAEIAGGVLALDTHPDEGPALVRRLGEYLAAAQQLWNFVDAWRES